MDDDQASNYFEYDYDQKVEGRYKRKRILYVIFASFAVLALTAACCIGKVKLLLWAAPVVFMMAVYTARYLFKYFQNEYKYTVERSAFTMYLIHGKGKPAVLYSFDAKTAEAVVKYDETTAAQYPEDDFDLIYRSYITKEIGDLYMAIFTDKNGKKCLGYFEAGKKALSIMKYYNKNVQLCDTLRH